MRKSWRNNIVTAFVLLGLLMTACSNHKHAGQADTYTCPMHPTVVSDKQGVCPVCGMDLVRKAREGEEVKISEDLAKIIKSPNEVVASKIKTIKPAYKAMDGSVDAVGIVTYDSRNLYTISARTGGRLERVYIKYPFQKVSKGQKIVEIYSPELVAAQRELLFLLGSDAGNKELIDGARNKLQLLGFSNTQIDELVRGKEPSLTVSIYSPYNGYVVKEGQNAPATAPSSATASGMGAMAAGSNSQVSTPTPESSTELTRVGSYVSAGQTIFKIVNTSSLFVELNLLASGAGLVKTHGDIFLDLGSGNSVKEKIDLVQPFVDRGQEFTKLRVYMGNDNIQIGTLVKATVPVSYPETLWVPKEAIVDLGVDQVVFVKDREVFRGRKVQTGIRSEGWIEIRNGLASSDDLAANAQYLVDSESFIKSR